ncbi:MAG: energy-coupling factor ABC transporter ATP-binding protein [Bacillota bacterium]
MSHHTIEVEDLRYAYPDGTNALQGVSFRITHGESVAVIGTNGAGKSTLLLHLAGLLFPQAGRIRLGGIPVSRQTIPQVRRRVGLVFQDPDDQLFMPTVYEDVAFAPLNMGVPPEEVEELVGSVLEQVGAAHLADRPSYRLSHGEKRAVAMAAVMAGLPDVLLLDEPTAGLDPQVRRRLIGLLGEFTHTKIIATHDLDLAWELCPRTIVLAAGTVAADGPSRRILADEDLLRRCGLELPLRLQGCPLCGGQEGRKS